MLITPALCKHKKTKKESPWISENKSRDKATYLNCFCRSLMFRRVATLPGIGSGSLFLKALSISSLAYFIIFFFVLYNLKWLGPLSVMLLVICVFIAASEYVLCTLLFAFIFNLFLADKLMRVMNIFVFSGSHGVLISTVLLSIATYKVQVHSVETFAQRKTANTSIIDPANGAARISYETGLNIILENKLSMLFLLMFFIVSFVAFFVLLIKNIRALRRK